MALAYVTGNEEIHRNGNLQKVQVISLLSSLLRCYFDEMCCDGEFL